MTGATEGKGGTSRVGWILSRELKMLLHDHGWRGRFYHQGSNTNVNS